MYSRLWPRGVSTFNEGQEETRLWVLSFESWESNPHCCPALQLDRNFGPLNDSSRIYNTAAVGNLLPVRVCHENMGHTRCMYQIQTTTVPGISKSRNNSAPGLIRPQLPQASGFGCRVIPKNTLQMLRKLYFGQRTPFKLGRVPNRRVCLSASQPVGLPDALPLPRCPSFLQCERWAFPFVLSYVPW